MFKEKDPAVLGGMFAVWNDHAGNGISTKDIHDRVFPALQTLAVKMWTGKEAVVSYDEFNQKRVGVIEAPGVNQAGKLAAQPGLVYEKSVLKPGEHTPYTEIGYNYRVSFDVEGEDELPGTELIRSGECWDLPGTVI